MTFPHLSNHNGESKDSNKVVDELEDNLKQGGGVWQTTNGDQSLHCKVVTADVTVERPKHAIIKKIQQSKLALSMFNL